MQIKITTSSLFIAKRSWRWYKTIAVSALVLVGLALIILPSHADGRVYTREEVSVCRVLAHISGIYAVYARHDAEARTRTFDIVLSPGAKAGEVGPRVRDILAAQPGRKWIVSVTADIYTYHDPTKTEDFRRTFSASEFYYSVYGFPDYRASLVAVAQGSYNPVTGERLGAWTITRVYSDPARFRTGD